MNIGHLAVATLTTILLGTLLAWIATRLYDRERLLY